MIVAGTGHRQLNGKYYPDSVWNPICQKVANILEELSPDIILSGAALGFDSLLIDAAIALNIPYVMVIPFDGQENAWLPKSREKYRKYRKLAKELVIVSEGGYSADKMQVRNQHLVDHSDMLIALYEPDRPSGTQNCLNYAKSQHKSIIHLNPKELI